MDELDELRLKGELSESGFLKERYDKNLDELVHTITEKGKVMIKEILKDPNEQKLFITMAVEEAKKHPGQEMEFLEIAINKMKEFL